MATKDSKPLADPENSSLAELRRRFKAHPVLFVGTILVLILVVVTFVMVPAFSGRNAGTTRLTFGYYDKQPIDYMPGNYFAQQRDYYNQQLRNEQTEQNMQFAAFQIWRSAFEATTIHTMALQQMKAAGWSTPKQLVDRQMAKLAIFQENGRFSAVRYEAVSQTERMNIRTNLIDEIAFERYSADVLNLRVPSKEIEFIKAIASPARSFDLVAFHLDSYPDSEVAAYIAANPALFQSVHFSKITIAASEVDASKVLASIKDGTTSFEDAAKSQSKDSLAEAGGDMGAKSAYELNTEIPDEAARAAVLALAPGALSAVTKVPAGWAIFRCEAAPVPADPADAAAVAKARAYLSSFERGRVEDWLIAKAGEFAAKAAASGFDAAVGAYALTKQTFGPVSLNYGDVELYRSISSFNLAELSGASTSDAFLKAAFSAPVGSLTAPVVLGDNVLVLKVNEERQADESSTAVIDFYYSYIANQYAQASLRDFVMNNDKFDDRFYDVFIKSFMPSQN
jgi:parvulin-like peptidyl-prolyl isomerase